MKKTVLVVMALAGSVLAAQSPALTPEQTLERRGIGELDFSPDRTRVVFTVTEPVKGTARQRNVWMLDVASGHVRQLTFSAKSDSAPRWAPDGRSIAFLSDRERRCGSPTSAPRSADRRDTSRSPSRHGESRSGAPRRRRGSARGPGKRLAPGRTTSDQCAARMTRTPMLR